MVRAGQAFVAKGEPKPHSFSHLRAQNITLNFRLFWPSVLILKLFRGVNFRSGGRGGKGSFLMQVLGVVAKGLCVG